MFAKKYAQYRQIESDEAATAPGDQEAVAEFTTPSLRTLKFERTTSWTSLLVNIVLILDFFMLHGRKTCPVNQSVSNHAELTFNKDTVLTFNNDYWGENLTAADALWDTVKVFPVVTLSPEEIRQFNLPPSYPFPCDQTRSIYFLQGQHLLHCTKIMYGMLREQQRDGKTLQDYEDFYHCLDGLRQYLQCDASDVLLAANAAEHTLGEQQVVQCRDLSLLEEWVHEPERDACYELKDVNNPPKHSLELYAHCRESSPYLATMEAYFEEW